MIIHGRGVRLGKACKRCGKRIENPTKHQTMHWDCGKELQIIGQKNWRKKSQWRRKI